MFNHVLTNLILQIKSVNSAAITTTSNIKVDNKLDLHSHDVFSLSSKASLQNSNNKTISSKEKKTSE